MVVFFAEKFPTARSAKCQVEETEDGTRNNRTKCQVKDGTRNNSNYIMKLMTQNRKQGEKRFIKD